MYRLRLAQHGYETLAPALTRSLDEQTSDRAEAWLRDEVCPVIQELSTSSKFRLAARWSHEHISKGSEAAERRLVDAVDEALVGLAGALTAVADRLVDAGPPELADRHLRDTIELIARRPWFDLVDPGDFFHAESGLLLLESNQKHTLAFRNRGELRIPLGDYVLRSLLARVDYWKSILDRAWNGTFHGVPSGDKGSFRASQRLFSARIELDRAVGRLTSVCLSGEEPKRREACATLVQAYAGYASGPDLKWLGCPPGWAEASRGMIRSCVRRRGEVVVVTPNQHGSLVEIGRRRASLCDPDVLRQIASALCDVVPLYELPDDPDDLIEWALDHARLVLVDRSTRAVYWQKEPAAEGRWDQRPREWELLWALAQQPGRPIDQGMLTMPEGQAIKSRRHRLSLLLDNVLSLDGMIETVRGQGYCLQIDAGEVILLRDSVDGRLVVHWPGRRSAP